MFFILGFLLKEYFSPKNAPFQEVVNYIEDKIIMIYWSHNSSPAVSKELRNLDMNSKPSKNANEEEIQEESDRSFCKGALKFNKHLNSLIKDNTLTIEEEDYGKFKKSLVLVTKELKEKREIKDEAKKVFYGSILRITLIVQVLFLKNSQELDDTLFDLEELLNKATSKAPLDADFHKILTEIYVQLISFASPILTEFTLKLFRRAAKYFNKSSVEVLVDFIKS